MTIDDGIAAFLKAGLSTDRVYSHRAPQNLPTALADPAYIVFYRISAGPGHTHSGPIVKGIERTYQFSVFHMSQSVALAMADRLRRLMDGFRGLMGTVNVSGCFWAGETYSYTQESSMHGMNVDMRITYKDTE
jgi:hypothetical protein